MGLLDTILGFLSSPGGAATVNAAGGALSAYGQSQQSDGTRQLRADKLGTDALTAQTNEDRANAGDAATLNPLGTEQRFASRQVMKRAIFGVQRPIMHAGQTSPGVASAVPNGGYDPAMLDAAYGPASTLTSLTSNAKQQAGVNPAAPPFDFSMIGGDPNAAAKASADVDAYQRGVQGTQAGQRGAVANYLNAATSGTTPTPLPTMTPLRHAILGGPNNVSGA